MLTAKQNFLETINGGAPERLVNQFEYLELVSSPIAAGAKCAKGETKVTDWGYVVRWDEGTPGAFPVHTQDALLVKDITRWRDVVQAPDPRRFTDEQWAPFVEKAASFDRNEKYVACMKSAGLFERLHYLMAIDNALIALYEEPEAVKELIEYIADWEIEVAKVLVEKLKPDALFQHDDWGTQINSFFSPEAFNEFFVPSYKRIYGFWKEHGVELIVHHSDSYAANLVPAMIDIGIDVWQGAVQENDIPVLLGEYGGRIAIHGGMDNGKYDTEDWSQEKIRQGLKELVDACGIEYFIPGTTLGGPTSTYPGVYDAVTAEIDSLSKSIF